MNPELYYEQSRIWEKNFLDNPFWAQKARVMTAMIPSDVRTILDVGCGNGAMANILVNTYAVYGADRSKAALSSLSIPRVCCESDRIPFKSAAFDLVLCSEILEHLPGRSYTNTIREIKRLSLGYILLSVPFKENLRFRFMRCAVCKGIFHVWGHVRRFDLSSIRKHFCEYQVLQWAHCGVYSRDYHPILCRIRQKIAGVWFCGEGSHPLCPKCGNTKFPAQPHTFLSRLCDDINARLGHQTAKTPYWLVVLLRKRENSNVLH
jgi:SAM-dependent methyltransferase